jgi:transcription initiation factor TFIID TATA-box-binding protein
MTKLELVNVVASGRLGRELDLAVVSESSELNNDSRVASIEHSQKSGERVLIRFNDLNSLGILSRKGACIITGAKSLEEMNITKDVFLNALQNASIIPDQSIEDFAIQNIVFVTTIDEYLNLNAVAILLGFENAEYEPEQFPGLVYRPEGTSCVLLLFGSGKVVVTGSRSKEEARDAVKSLKTELETL